MRSILGRYLEHSRIFSFHNDGDPQVFIGSADMMHRNLDRRVEALVRLTDPEAPQPSSTSCSSRALRRTHLVVVPRRRRRLDAPRDLDEDGEPLDDLQNTLMQQIARPAARRGSDGPRLTRQPIYAAGAVCWRLVDGKIDVLVIHRTEYGDVTLPKGKVDPGETLPQTAVREIHEETGLAVALGVPLGVSTYPLSSGRDKIVHYWAAEVSDEAIARSTFVPNDEVAALEWVTIKKARGYLTYERDVEILDAFAELLAEGVDTTFALIALRHGKAAPPPTGRTRTRPGRSPARRASRRPATFRPSPPGGRGGS